MMIARMNTGKRSSRRWICEMGTVLLVFAGLAWLLMEQCASLHNILFGRSTQWILLLGLISGIVPVFYLLFQAVMVCFYSPFVRWPEELPLPGCTVIVPAYNEGACVAETLRSLLQSDYPPEKLEIIAINDGSADDTWNWIQLAAGESNGMIRAVNLKQNGGKKHALAIGFREAKNEIVVTVDSDSLVHKDTIRKLIMPFSDPKIGGVAGVVRVRNIHDGIIPKMLDVCFVFSCDYVRCAQSVTGTVLCSPGAISAYRRESVLPCLDEWLAQTFLGKPSLIGEDRALTSLLLRNSWYTVLQNNAGIVTNVPVHYPQLCRMLLRWSRGDIREGILMIGHFFRRFDFTDFRLTALQITLICQLLGLTLPVILLPCTFYVLFTVSSLLFFATYTLIISWFWATIPAILYAQRETPLKAVWAFFYAGYNFLALSWIGTYAWFTVGNSRWMTRDLARKENRQDLTVSAGRNLS